MLSPENLRDSSPFPERKIRSVGKQNSVQGFQCYNCEEYGHIARNCPKNSSLRCYGCGKMGHMLRNCVNKNCNNNGRMYGVTCGLCGVSGHAMMNCKDFVRVPELVKGKYSRTQGC